MAQPAMKSSPAEGWLWSGVAGTTHPVEVEGVERVGADSGISKKPSASIEAIRRRGLCAAPGGGGIVAVIGYLAYSPVVIRPMPHDSIEVNFTRLDPELPVPASAYIGDAAVDLHCRVGITLAPGERAAVPTGLAVALPEGFAGVVIPRSGHALHRGLGLVNSPGLIDSGYRGEIRVIVINHGEETVSFQRGDRIAQLAVLPIPKVRWVEVENLDETQRGAAGFGSSGS